AIENENKGSSGVKQNLERLDWPEIVAKLESYATSEVCRETLRSLAPLKTVEKAQKSFEQVHEAQLLLQKGARPFMESLDLFHVWHQRLSKEATLKTLELKDVRHFCLEALALSEILQLAETSWLGELRSILFDASEP